MTAGAQYFHTFALNEILPLYFLRPIKDHCAMYRKAPMDFNHSPRWVRGAAVASALGISTKLMWAEIAAGRVPVRTAEIGARRIRHIDADDARALADSLQRRAVHESTV